MTPCTLQCDCAQNCGCRCPSTFQLNPISSLHDYITTTLGLQLSWLWNPCWKGGMGFDITCTSLSAASVRHYATCHMPCEMLAATNLASYSHWTQLVKCSHAPMPMFYGKYAGCSANLVTTSILLSLQSIREPSPPLHCVSWVHYKRISGISSEELCMA